MGKFWGWLLLAAFFSFNATAATYYVNVSNPAPVSPYSDWSTAATNIQDAVDAASTGDLVLVTNGVYATGGRTVNGFSLTNRVTVTKPITLQSVNGPNLTLIQGNSPMGNGAVRCAYLTNGVILSGFTLTNGATKTSGDITNELSGAGAWCASVSATISNCILTGCSAKRYGGGVYRGTINDSLISSNNAPYGGGAYSNVLNNCVLKNNFAAAGGGAYGGSLTHCTIVNNTAYAPYTAVPPTGGGVFDGNVMNCVIFYNNSYYGTTSVQGSNFYSNGNIFINYCCTTPLPTNGVGNITNEPVFVDLAGGDFHLSSNSPCINAGNNAYVTNAIDLDGLPRIVGGTVDIGAYEYQTPASTLSYAWAQQYGLPTDGTADGADTDGDGMNNWQEWKASTVPTNAASVLQLASPSNSLSGMIVKWQSVGGVNYYLQRGTNLATQPTFTSIQSNIVGQVGTTSYTDTTATNATPYFYRVGVQ